MLNCIDVSSYQQNVDWAKAKQNGITVAIARAGVRGYLYNNLQQDSFVVQNMNGIMKNGLQGGLYFFSQAITPAEAVVEANFCINLALEYGYSCTAGIWFDSELSGAPNLGGRADNLSVSARTACAKAFCDTVINANFVTGIYASSSWFSSKLDMNILKNYNLWVADYRGYIGYSSDKILGWQFTSSLILPWVSGNNGRTDGNEWYQKFDTQQTQPLSYESVFMQCFATGNDNKIITAQLESLLIPYLNENNLITTLVAVSAGDQVTLIDVAQPLGIAWQIFYPDGYAYNCDLEKLEILKLQEQLAIKEIELQNLQSEIENSKKIIQDIQNIVCVLKYE